jgi:hypothetical protein
MTPKPMIDREELLTDAVNSFLDDEVYHLIYTFLEVSGVDPNDIPYSEIREQTEVAKVLKEAMRKIVFNNLN